jgi:hypothetical protein
MALWSAVPPAGFGGFGYPGTMRTWRLADGILQELERSSTPVPHGIDQYLPEGPWRELRDFRRLGPSGELRTEYAVQVASVEEELFLIAHGVVDGRLERITLSVFCGPHFRVRHDTRTLLDGLREGC